MTKATFAAGCFWGVETAFRQLDGVLSTAVGYMGGTTESPTYQDVCTGTTGHAEVAQVEFDPDRISYEELLQTFWKVHNPTTRNRQGPDIGTQYRSAVFFHDPEQEQAVRESKEKLDQSGRCPGPIVTQIEPAADFFLAEDYHQQYLEKRGQSSCRIP